MSTKTPVSLLQELMQARNLELPRYLEESYGTKFKCTVFAGGIVASGISTTKKAAKHASAQNALELLNCPKPVQVILVQESYPPQKPLENFVGMLNEYASKRGLSYPDYDLIPNSGLLENKYVMKCTFQNRQTIGYGLNKKDAKQDSARAMLKFVEENDSRNCASGVSFKTVTKPEDIEKIIALYNNLSCHEPPKQHQQAESMGAAAQIEINHEESVEVLMAKLMELGVQYTLSDFQTEPEVIVSLVISGTNFTFLESGKTREEAVKKVLQKVLLVKKSGCSFNTDLISL